MPLSESLAQSPSKNSTNSLNIHLNNLSERTNTKSPANIWLLSDAFSCEKKRTERKTCRPSVFRGFNQGLVDKPLKEVTICMQSAEGDFKNRRHLTTKDESALKTVQASVTS